MKIFKTLSVAMLLTLISSSYGFAEALTVNAGPPVVQGSSGVSVDINIDEGSNTAGASFTVTYDSTKLTLIDISSSFFGSFASQNITPSSITIGTDTYTQGLVYNLTTSGVRVAAAQTTNGEVGPQTLFTLTFDVAGDATGDCPINIESSIIENEAAGYSTPTAIPMLVGIDNQTTPVSYPSITPSVSPGNLLVISADTDGDGLNDDIELNMGTDPYLADSDGDGLNDGEEFSYWGDNWDADADADGQINILDDDSDDDSIVDGTEIAHGFDPADTDSRPGLSNLLVIGEVQVTDSWSRIELETFFTHPVVLAKVVSNNESEPCLIRLRNIDVNGFDVRLQEYDYQDGIHGSETVSYIVLEQGNYSLQDGTLIEAGSFTVSGTSFLPYTFQLPFNTVPMVIASVATFEDSQAVTGRINNVGFNSFEFRLQEQELNTDGHNQETVNYIAWESSSGAINNVSFEVGGSGNSVNHTFTAVSYTDGFQNLPIMLLDMQTTNGSDPASVRIGEQTFSRFTAKIEEEQSFDIEVAHYNPEVVGYIAFAEQQKAFAPEFGEVDIDHNWTRVTFDTQFSQPVVVVGPPSYNGVHPCVIRIANPDTTGFDIRIQEYDYLDGSHALETVNYMVMDMGTYTLENGKRVEAGTFTATDSTFIDQAFKGTFSEPPVILTSVATVNDEQAVTGRIRNLTVDGFEYRMDEQQSYSDGHSAETIHYIAWEPSVGTIGDMAYEVNNAANLFDSSFASATYATSFQDIPIVLAGMQTTNGGDTAGLRSQAITSTGFEIKVEEEQSYDGETFHVPEVVGYIAFAQQQKAFAPEFGEVDIDHNWASVTFETQFSQPVVVVGPPSYNGVHPCVIRIANLDTTGFDIRIQEYDYLDGSHALETVSYMVMDMGTYTLENGKQVEAGIFTATDLTFRRQTFNGTFSESPVLLTSVATVNDGQAVTGRIRNLTMDGFDYLMNEQESYTDGHSEETIHYIAWEPSMGTIGEMAYEVSNAANLVDSSFASTEYATSFQNFPIVLAGMQTTNGGDTAGLRSQAITSTGFEIKAEEEQSYDGETFHVPEMVGYLAVARE